MTVVFPRPLRPGDRIGVTSPSSGVEEPLLPLVNGASARVVMDGERQEITRTLADSRG